MTVLQDALVRIKGLLVGQHWGAVKPLTVFHCYNAELHQTLLLLQKQNSISQTNEPKSASVCAVPPVKSGAYTFALKHTICI